MCMGRSPGGPVQRAFQRHLQVLANPTVRPHSGGRQASSTSMTTALHRNPFHVLGATPQDSSARLRELADEKALIVSPEACQAACAQLVSPRTRLIAELGWL